MSLFLVLAMRRPLFDPADVPAHRAFLDELRVQGVLERAGPFGDQSGGAYLIHAADLAEATAIVHRDPAYTGGGWDITFYEWLAH